MRLSSVLTLACAITALILSILCLLAGSSKSFLQNADLMTLNVSRIGHTTLFETDDGDGGFFDNLINDIQGEVNDLISDATSDIASLLNLPDFFNIHLLDYCQGSYTPDATAKHPSHNVTECSKRTTSFHFSPTKLIQEHLPDGITLLDLHWPDEIQDIEKMLKVASMAMVVFYIIGITFSGIAIPTAIWGILSDRRLSAIVNFLVDGTASLTLGIASLIATIIAVKAADTINTFGSLIGIAAYKGGTFLGMTWAATAVMLLASVLSFAQYCAGRRKNKRHGEKGAY